MTASLGWLGLDIDDPATAREFYEPLLGDPYRDVDGSLHFEAGSSELRLYPPDADATGGKHVHYAFSTGTHDYSMYKARLQALTDIEEHHLDVYRSVYAFDPDEHCVEFAERDGDRKAISGIFEIVLEVDDLVRAEKWYQRFGADLMDRGTERRRVRLDMGDFELELWEPQRGIADAQPGREVNLGVEVPDPDGLVERLEPGSERIEESSSGILVVDGDGHHITLY